jgi:GNAT superfamily N-acetyltransferase
MNVRHANTNDLYRLSMLWLKLGYEINPDFKPDVGAWRAQKYQQMSNPNYVLLLVERDNEIIGYVDGTVVYVPSLSAKLGQGSHIYILPKYRNTSAAARLYKAVVKFAIDHGATYISVSPKPNTEAETMYLKRGFVPIEVLMMKPIEDIQEIL